MLSATECCEEALREAALQFLSENMDGPIAFRKCSGGVNNRVYYVDQGNKVYVLRVYNNGGNRDRVRYEHRVLELLSSSALPFFVPHLLRTHRGASFAPLSHASLEPNTEACMFRLIPGQVAQVTSLPVARSAGKATAILVREMSNMPPLDLACPNPRFRDVYQACPGVSLTPQRVRDIVAQPVFDACRQDAHYLLDELDRVYKAASDAEKHHSLPEQQIHADLHLDNFLADPSSGQVTGALDFEFSAFDWRVMEMCVGLTKYIATDNIDIRLFLSEWIDGYADAGERLTDDEISFVPDGIVLRILSNVVFFAGRATTTPPQDRIETLVKKIEPYARRCRWVEQNRQWLIETLKSKLKK